MYVRLYVTGGSAFSLCIESAGLIHRYHFYSYLHTYSIVTGAGIWYVHLSSFRWELDGNEMENKYSCHESVLL